MIHPRFLNPEDFMKLIHQNDFNFEKYIYLECDFMNCLTPFDPTILGPPLKMSQNGGCNVAAIKNIWQLTGIFTNLMIW